MVAFKSDGSVLLNELAVTLPHVAGEGRGPRAGLVGLTCWDVGSWGPGAQEAGQGRVPVHWATRASAVGGGSPLRHQGACPHCALLAASFSIFQPSSYHIVVNTALGLRLQVQLVPVMQLFVTLDQAAQGQVQGEWPHLALPAQVPPQPRPLPTVSWPPRALRGLQWPGK